MTARPAVPRRAQQRLETRERLFQAALDEFRRAGFADAQIDRIVQAAGVARGTFYFHFPTKDHVLFELQRRGEESIVQRLESARPRTVRAFLLKVIDALLEEETVIGTGLLRDLLSVHARRPVELDARREPLLAVLTRFFAAGAERGEVRSDLSPEDLTQLFLTSLFGFMLRTVDAPADRRPVLRRVVDVFVSGVAR